MDKVVLFREFEKSLKTVSQKEMYSYIEDTYFSMQQEIENLKRENNLLKLKMKNIDASDSYYLEELAYYKDQISILCSSLKGKVGKEVKYNLSFLEELFEKIISKLLLKTNQINNLNESNAILLELYNKAVEDGMENLEWYVELKKAKAMVTDKSITSQEINKNNKDVLSLFDKISEEPEAFMDLVPKLQKSLDFLKQFVSDREVDFLMHGQDEQMFEDNEW